MKRNALVYFIGTNIHRLFIFITADSNNNSNNNNTENDRTIIIFVEKSKQNLNLLIISSNQLHVISLPEQLPSYAHMFSGPMGPSSQRK